ncbi:hypothetical protein [Streptomyces sp. GC420]|uniref:hypothetical protein n=1 Tax=Streptomyces sp. GC420 TaxID=2697568 RepID=UPI0014152D3B|nr:hypothetical protein [Streptomyces sp. GC420]NBM16730.1 hypothetical protein [Streptomyces sp. GC420]
MNEIDWGDAPTWVGAIFAALAAGAAAWTLKSQRDQIREQREFIAQQAEVLTVERDVLLLERKERTERQARGVRLSGHRFEGIISADDQAASVLVHNESEAEIQEIKADFGHLGPAVGACEWGELGSGEQLPLTVPVLSRGSSCYFQAREWKEDDHPRNYVPRVSFTDSHGRRWCLAGDNLTSVQ